MLLKFYVALSELLLSIFESVIHILSALNEFRMVIDAGEIVARSLIWRSMITMYVDVRDYVYLIWVTLCRRDYCSLVPNLFLLHATNVFLVLNCQKFRISGIRGFD